MVRIDIVEVICGIGGGALSVALCGILLFASLIGHCYAIYLILIWLGVPEYQ